MPEMRLASYNQVVRILVVLSLALSLAACHRSARNDEAVRQGVIDYLAQKGLNVQGMNVAVTNLNRNGNQADATVSITPKGGNPSQGMSMQYQLEQRGDKWTVTGRKEAGGAPHGGGAMPPGMESPHGGGMPGAENPHGGGMPPAASGPGSKMPSPEDLPPVKKQ
jgi:hypothetical protein